MAKLTTPKKYCTIYIIRHGETKWNVEFRIQGHSDSPLTREGLNQAKRLAKRFRKVKFDAIFSSDLLRAKRTAEVIALDKKLALKTSVALREKNYGHMEGKLVEDFNQKFKDLLKTREKLSSEEQFKLKLAPDIETDEELMTRFIIFLREIAIGYIHKKVLIVTHGGVIRILLIHLGYGTREELPAYSINNTAYIKMLSDGIDFFVEKTFGVNKTANS